MKIILLGYMGSGKTSVGIALSRILPHQFVDLDSAIEKECKLSISEIFKTKGEIFFRKKEVEVLNSLLNNEESQIIATGGGTPCYGSVMENLVKAGNCTTVYLKATIDTLTDRLWEERLQRPLITHLATKTTLKDFVRKHLFERGFYYNQSKIKIDTDNKLIKEIAENLVVTLF